MFGLRNSESQRSDRSDRRRTSRSARRPAIPNDRSRSDRISQTETSDVQHLFDPSAGKRRRGGKNSRPIRRQISSETNASSALRSIFSFSVARFSSSVAVPRRNRAHSRLPSRFARANADQRLFRRVFRTCRKSVICSSLLGFYLFKDKDKVKKKTVKLNKISALLRCKSVLGRCIKETDRRLKNVQWRTRKGKQAALSL